MNNFSRGEDYILSKSYAEYILKRLRKGGIWNVISSISRYVRKLSFISAVIRFSSMVFLLLEKSAVLLLIFSSLVILLPAITATAVIMGIACTVKYAVNHKKITSWIKAADQILIYLTSAYTSKHPLFMRCAENASKSYNTRVIVLCKGNFVAFSQYSNDILRVKADYYFILKAFYLRKMSKSLIYVALT